MRKLPRGDDLFRGNLVFTGAVNQFISRPWSISKKSNFSL